MKCDDEGPFRRIYAVGRAGSRTPDPYDSQGVQLQVRVHLQLDIHSFVAVCRVLRSARKNEKNASGGWPEDENVVTARHKAGFALGKCTPGVGKVWERVPSTFPDPTSLALDDCIPYRRGDTA